MLFWIPDRLSKAGYQNNVPIYSTLHTIRVFLANFVVKFNKQSKLFIESKNYFSPFNKTRSSYIWKCDKKKKRKRGNSSNVLSRPMGPTTVIVHFVALKVLNIHDKDQLNPIIIARDVNSMVGFWGNFLQELVTTVLWFHKPKSLSTEPMVWSVSNSKLGSNTIQNSQFNTGNHQSN